MSDIDFSRRDSEQLENFSLVYNGYTFKGQKGSIQNISNYYIYDCDLQNHEIKVKTERTGLFLSSHLIFSQKESKMKPANQSIELDVIIICIMEGEQSKENPLLTSLIHKVRRLRRKLLSYGWNRQQSTHFILFEFLKLPAPQWEKPSTTVSYYQIKEKFKVESSQAELILSLQQIVPNIHQEDVLEYLHSVFQYSALNYGFQVFDSSSDSSENPHLVKKPLKTLRPLRHRTKYRDFSPSSRKKLHKKEQQWSPKHAQRQEPRREQLKLVRKRKQQNLTELDEWQKTLKKQEND